MGKRSASAKRKRKGGKEETGGANRPREHARRGQFLGEISEGSSMFITTEHNGWNKGRGNGNSQALKKKSARGAGDGKVSEKGRRKMTDAGRGSERGERREKKGGGVKGGGSMLESVLKMRLRGHENKKTAVKKKKS